MREVKFPKPLLATMAAVALSIAVALNVPKNKVKVEQDEICVILKKREILSEITKLENRHKSIKESVRQNKKLSPSDYLFFRNYDSIMAQLNRSLVLEQKDCQLRFNIKGRHLGSKVLGCIKIRE
jgi:hypothetical protein